MTREELLARLAGLRQARVGPVRAPHKPLLLLWLFGQFAVTGSSAASYQQAAEPVSRLINDFGPPMASPAARHGPPRPSFIWNATCGTCGTCATPLARRSARTLPSAAAGCWTAEP